VIAFRTSEISLFTGGPTGEMQMSLGSRGSRMLVSMVKSFKDMFGPFPDMFDFKSLAFDAGSLFV